MWLMWPPLYFIVDDGAYLAYRVIMAPIIYEVPFTRLLLGYVTRSNSHQRQRPSLADQNYPAMLFSDARMSFCDMLPKAENLAGGAGRPTLLRLRIIWS
jgi:hypothetical protein